MVCDVDVENKRGMFLYNCNEKSYTSLTIAWHTMVRISQCLFNDYIYEVTLNVTILNISVLSTEYMKIHIWYKKQNQ